MRNDHINFGLRRNCIEINLFTDAAVVQGADSCWTCVSLRDFEVAVWDVFLGSTFCGG